MNEQPHNANSSAIDPQLEARLVALALGEASDFERAELEQLVEQSPSLAAYLEEVHKIHHLLEAAGEDEMPPVDEEWKLSDSRRDHVLAVISGEVDPDQGQPNKLQRVVAKLPPTRLTRWRKRTVLAISTVTALLLMVAFIGSSWYAAQVNLQLAESAAAKPAPRDSSGGSLAVDTATSSLERNAIRSKKAAGFRHRLADSEPAYESAAKGAGVKLVESTKQSRSALGAIKEAVQQSTPPTSNLEPSGGRISTTRRTRGEATPRRDDRPLGVEMRERIVADPQRPRQAETNPMLGKSSHVPTAGSNIDLSFQPPPTPFNVRVNDAIDDVEREPSPRNENGQRGGIITADGDDTVKYLFADSGDEGLDGEGRSVPPEVNDLAGNTTDGYFGGGMGGVGGAAPVRGSGRAFTPQKTGPATELSRQLQQANEPATADAPVSVEDSLQRLQERLQREAPVHETPLAPSQQVPMFDSSQSVNKAEQSRPRLSGRRSLGKFKPSRDPTKENDIRIRDSATPISPDHWESGNEDLRESFSSESLFEEEATRDPLPESKRLDEVNQSHSRSAASPPIPALSIQPDDSGQHGNQIELQENNSGADPTQGSPTSGRLSGGAVRGPTAEFGVTTEEAPLISGFSKDDQETFGYQRSKPGQRVERSQEALPRWPSSGRDSSLNSADIGAVDIDSMAAKNVEMLPAGAAWQEGGQPPSSPRPQSARQSRSANEFVTRTEDRSNRFARVTPKPSPKPNQIYAQQAPVGLDETSADDERFSTFSLHVSDVSFKLAQSALARGEWPDPAKIRIEEFVNAFDYGDPLPGGDEKVACSVEQARHPFLLQRNLLRVSMRTSAAGRSSDTPLRLTLLLDNSGSMERMDRQKTVRRAFAALAAQLKPIDQATLISFARQPRLMADQTSGTQSAKLVELIDALPSEGGTNIEAALQLAFEKAREQQVEAAQNRVILLTDGAVNLGNANPDSLSQMVTRMRDAGIAFDAAGISADGLNDEVLEALTRQGDGRYYLLDSAESADDGFAQQIAGALRPSAKNVKVQIQFNPKRVGQYKLLGFEQHRLNKEDFHDDNVDAAEMAAAESGVALYQFEAKPDGVGDVGSVSVRFRDVSTGQMVEHRWPIPYESEAPRLDQAAPSLRIATSAAMLAAKLRGEPLGETVELKKLSDLLASLPAKQRRTNRVQQLEQMIQQVRER